MDGRHHRAHAPQPAVIFVEVPAAGSPKQADRVKPPRYERDPPTHWRPARAIPVRQRKAEGLRRLLDYMRRQDEIVAEFMKPTLLR